MRKSILVALAHAPFLSVPELALLEGVGERSIRRSLDVRVARGEAGDVMHPATRCRLYYLTAAGVVAAAGIMRREPRELAGRYGLGENALLRRLPALDRLLAGRAVLLRLAVALARTGGALEDWRTYPVRWPCIPAGQQDPLLLDGEATLRFADGLRCVVGYLWDGHAEAPEAALSARLDALAAVRTCPAYATPYPARVPPVLLVTADLGRVPAGYRAGLLWTTVDALDLADPLAAGWRSTAGPGGPAGERDLRTALDRLGVMRPRPTPAATARVPATLCAPRRPDTLRRRAERVHRAPAREPAPQDLLVLPVVLPPRAWPLLECVGQHPLLDRHDLATVLERDPFDTWDLLRHLCHHGLCHIWRPTEPRKNGRAWRYGLAARGTVLLARGAGLTPAAYRQAHGVLDDAREAGEGGLAYARRYLDHTDGINAAYLAFLAAARDSGRTLWWRGEWACARTYHAPEGSVQERTHARTYRGPEGSRQEPERLLRPDAELRCAGPHGSLHAFLEIDRGTEPATELYGKITQYDDYRAAAGADDLTVLLVTPGPHRADEPLAAARALARKRRVPVLDVRATTAVNLATHGPWAPIWQDAHGRLHSLDA